MKEGDYVHTVALTGGRIAVLYSAFVGPENAPTDNGDIFLKIIDPSLDPWDPASIVTFPTRINRGSTGQGQQYTPTITEMKDGRVSLVMVRSFQELHCTHDRRSPHRQSHRRRVRV